MPRVYYGGTVNNTNYTTYYSNNYMYSDYNSGWPTGNLDQGGGRPVVVTGNAIQWNSGGTWADIVYFNGSGFRTRVGHGGGSLTVGRNTTNGSTTVDSADGDTVTGGIPGFFDWITVPAKITNLGGTASATSSGAINLTFSGPDNGGASISTYRLYRNGAYWTTSQDGTITDTGRTPGVTYTYTVSGVNSVGEATDSNVRTVVAQGSPNAPTGMTATRSTVTVNAIDLTWTAPTVIGVGGINGYKIYRNGSLFATTSGTGRTYKATGLTAGTNYSWTVAARNDWTDDLNSQGAQSASDSVTAEGVPSAPRTPDAVASGVTPGRIALSWTAPSYVGVGGVTGYEIYNSTGTLRASVSSATLTYNVDGLTPGVKYGFYIRAKNAISVADGVPGADSTTVYDTALGDPPAPTGLTLTPSTRVPGRLVLAWTAPTLGTVSVTGYTVFRASDNAKLAVVTSMNYVIDNLTPDVNYSYYVKARNTITDPAGSDGGPSSATITAKPTSTADQTMGALSGVVTSVTNATFNGTFLITATTATSFTFSKVSPNIAASGVPAGTTAVDNTNTDLNGTYTIGAPTDSTLTYGKVTPNIVADTATSGTLLDTTNQVFNGAYTVTAADAFNKTVSYAKTAPNVTSVASVGTVSNATNATFNGTGFTIIAPVTLNTFSYAKTAANVTEISATGTATDTTNRDYYNGTFIVKDVPAYNRFTYSRTV